MQRRMLGPLAILALALLVFTGVAAALVISGGDDDEQANEPVALSATAEPTATPTRTPTPTPTRTPTPTPVPRVSVEIDHLGLTVADVDAAYVEEYGLTQDEGAVVVAVEPGEPAAVGGIEEGDLIVAVSEAKVADAAALADLLPDFEAGNILISFNRGSATQTVFVTLLPGLGAIPAFHSLAAGDQAVIRELLRMGESAERVRRVLAALRGTNAVTGTVTSVTASELVVDAGEPQGEVTYAIDAGTGFFASGEEATVDAIAVGDSVFVTSLDGATALLVTKLPGVP